MLEKLRERLKLIAEHDIPEWAKRLEEVGGPGVGGTELAYAPHFITVAETQSELIKMALEDSIHETWEEAAWCYVFGEFRACIVLSAALLEITLKYELYRKGYEVSNKMLGGIIKECGEQGLFSEKIRLLAEAINMRRNDQ